MQGKKDSQEKLFASFQLAIAYNLKEYLKFIGKRAKSGAGMLVSAYLVGIVFYDFFFAPIRYPKTPFQYWDTLKKAP
ncbi:hypothetical protein [Maribacter luteus]|uniref:Uncharacterized protein n=1 Tax=Maribacter luteus TaxID=2594478 RepID=A0A6I2MR47_9FLAO|nr:hypothetical protein [Maribacter luteus]MRX64664.1 hypothetical protein [Maribacter luteus]